MIISNSMMPSMPATNYISCRVVVKDMYDHEENDWPVEFKFAPRRGDTIQAEDGRRLDVLSIIHTVQNGGPVVLVEVGVDKSQVTPMEGGGQDVVGEFA